MNSLLKFILAIGLVIGVSTNSLAQLFIVPQVNTGLPVGTAREYATPTLGYGAQAGYQLSSRWSLAAGFDQYRFGVSANLNDLLETPSALLDLFDLPEFLSVDMDARAWSGGFRYSIPYQGIIPFIGVSGSTNQLSVEGFGLSISRRYWGISPVVGAELPLTDHWGIQAEARVQTIFIRDIPFVQEIVKEHLVFVPVQLGVVFRLGR